MAKAVIFDKINGKVLKLKNSDFFLSRIAYSTYNVVLRTIGIKTSKIKTTQYPIPSFSYPKINTRAESVLPFRIKITNVMVEGYGPDNPAPIGIAIIGVNNYIL